MDISNNELGLIYTRTDLYQKQVELLDNIKESITDNQYLCLMNNVKKIKEMENEITEQIYKLIIFQVEFIIPPGMNMVMPNIIQNEVIGMNISDNAIEQIRQNIGDSLPARVLREMGFKIPVYAGYSIGSNYNDITRLKNDLIFIHRIQNPVYKMESTEFEEMGVLPPVVTIPIHNNL